MFPMTAFWKSFLIRLFSFKFKPVSLLTFLILFSLFANLLIPGLIFNKQTLLVKQNLTPKPFKVSKVYANEGEDLTLTDQVLGETFPYLEEGFSDISLNLRERLNINK